MSLFIMKPGPAGTKVHTHTHSSVVSGEVERSYILFKNLSHCVNTQQEWPRISESKLSTQENISVCKGHQLRVGLKQLQFIVFSDQKIFNRVKLKQIWHEIPKIFRKVKFYF